MENYGLGFFDERLKQAIGDATRLATERRCELNEALLLYVIATRGDVEAATDNAYSLGNKASHLGPPPPTGFFGRMLAGPTEKAIFSKRLKERLDETKYHARSAGADKANVLHFIHSISRGECRDALDAAGLTQDVTRDLISPAPEEQPVHEPEVEPVRVDTGTWTVEQCWQGIHAALERLDIDVADWFNGPASTDRIAALEAQTGVKLPADFVASLGIHDGSREQIHSVWVLMPLALIDAEWALVESDNSAGLDDVGQVDDGVRKVFWHSGWIPVLQANGNTEYLCLDTHPDDGGVNGQLITYAMDDIDRRVEFPSWTAYLRQLASEICSAEPDDFDHEFADQRLLDESEFL